MMMNLRESKQSRKLDNQIQMAIDKNDDGASNSQDRIIVSHVTKPELESKVDNA